MADNLKKMKAKLFKFHLEEIPSKLATKLIRNSFVEMSEQFVSSGVVVVNQEDFSYGKFVKFITFSGSQFCLPVIKNSSVEKGNLQSSLFRLFSHNFFT